MSARLALNTSLTALAFGEQPPTRPSYGTRGKAQGQRAPQARAAEQKARQP